ncbi:hypothetical protein B0I26_10561 [Anoxybacillus vitaminiphilus]|uniref:Uncharacterized protein n=1 Tax=Paranoxybacillus vitaminiphilus TaxID=581036 RepID=A0A327YNV4_9BACL|nr:hypothetical protein B0I26_10561 [Anoxybacillus vitaminiphilus]
MKSVLVTEVAGYIKFSPDFHYSVVFFKLPKFAR